MKMAVATAVIDVMVALSYPQQFALDRTLLGDPPPDAAGWRLGVAPLQPKAPPSQFLILKSCAVATSGGLAAM